MAKSELVKAVESVKKNARMEEARHLLLARGMDPEQVNAIFDQVNSRPSAKALTGLPSAIAKRLGEMLANPEITGILIEHSERLTITVTPVCNGKGPQKMETFTPSNWTNPRKK